jgi:hypothetical protein
VRSLGGSSGCALLPCWMHPPRHRRGSQQQQQHQHKVKIACYCCCQAGSQYFCPPRPPFKHTLVRDPCYDDSRCGWLLSRTSRERPCTLIDGWDALS